MCFIAVAAMMLATWPGAVFAAGALPPGAPVCETRHAIEQFMKTENADNPETIYPFRQKCFIAQRRIPVERVECNGYICQIRLVDFHKENNLAFTLRRYQP